jgi:ubiquinone/menaquinone biosynthesis C-methylase UbiE
MPEQIANDKQLYTSGRYVDHFRPAFEGSTFGALYAEKLDFILRSVPGERLRILDLGGGMGRMTLPLSSRHQVTLADLSLNMLQIAGQNGSGFDRINCDAEHLCFADASFDAVLAVDLLSHLWRVPEVLSGIRRVLRPGGLLIIDVTNSNPLWMLAYPRYVDPVKQPGRWLRTLLGLGVPPEWQGRVHHMSKRELKPLLRQADFDVREWKGFGPAWCPRWLLAVCAAQ